ncbi:MAG: DUF1974 domain-containing protein, partial [Deefgea sp.]
PVAGPTAQNYRDIVRFSSAFAFLADTGMATLGGSLKFKEKLSARLGDMLSNLYIATAALKKFHDDGQPKEDRPLVRWAVETALYDCQEAMHGFLANHPNRAIAWFARRVVFPCGMTLAQPADRVGTRIARNLMEPSTSRDRLVQFMYRSKDETDSVGVLEYALKAVIATEGIESKLRRAQRDGQLKSITAKARLQEALSLGLITDDEHAEIVRARRLKREVIMVDDFDSNLETADVDAIHRSIV